MTELQGQVEKVVYTDDESGFTIARVRVSARRELVTCVGPMIKTIPGELLAMKGEWTNHPRYGRQFRVDSCRTAVPATAKGIEKYLGSGLIKGIGPVMSKRIVSRFGTDTLNIIENDIDRLTEIPGIGEHRLKIIEKAWRDQKEIRSVMIFLQGHGVSSGYASRIFKQYGNEAVNIVTDNPYRLATDIPGIGFLTADRIAQNMGFSNDSLKRAEAGILYVLNGFAQEGHVCYPEDLLLKAVQNILGTKKDIIESALKGLILQMQVIVDGKIGKEDSAIYLPYLHAAETQAAKHLKALVDHPGKAPAQPHERVVEVVRKTLAMEPAPEQIRAVKASQCAKVMIITGGPGTGKTTIIRAVIAMWEAGRSKVLLAAPTGRAAKRLEETTDRPAKTIHRLLEFSGRQGGFHRNRDNPLACDLLIVDEASMIDIPLMHRLLEAVPLHATLILVGDVNQLPSVGPGNVLRDCIESGMIPVVKLNEVYRQARESAVIINAHRINRGETQLLDGSRNELSDFYFIEQENPEKAVETLIHLVAERIPSRFGLNPLLDVQVLSPMNKGTMGVDNLNLRLQEILNQRENGITRAGRTFRIGDKVLQTINNYDKDVFNGDIGIITEVKTDEQEITVSFDDRSIAYEYDELGELTPAYAITIHKSQGSEYPAVVIPLFTQHYMMLQRNLLYTAVTRGRKLVVVIGTKKALAIAIKNKKTQQRYSLLKKRLVERLP